MTADLFVGLIVLTSLFVLEGVLPFYQGHERSPPWRYLHGLRNGALLLVNGVIGALLAPLVLWVLTLIERHDLGLGPWLAAAWAGAGWPGAAAAGLAVIVAFDGWMYAWHRANHRVAFLWRFHQVHHTDTAMDCTTALRFHPGELTLSTIVNLPVLLLLGMSAGQFVLYKALMLCVILLHHSNLRLPTGLDRRLRLLIVPPSLHRVHHSRVLVETDSNYGTIFSFWDRLFGSLRLRADQAGIVFGTGRLDGDDWQSPGRLLRLPLQPSGSPR